MLPNHSGSTGTRSPGRHTLTLNHDGTPLVVDVWEPEQMGTDLPALLIHGWGASGSYWLPTAQALSKRRRVIVPDLPGTGRSQPVRTPQGMFEQTASLARVLDALAIERADLVGHSMGGAMGILMADAERDRVERLVLTSLCLFRSQAERRLFKVVTAGFRIWLALRKTPLAKASFFADRMASRYFHQPPEDPKWVKQLYEDFLGLDGASAIACASGATEPAIDEAAARLEAPTLLIVCRQDDLMPMLNVEHTASLIPDCRIHWMDGSGHLPMLERPDEYAQLLQEFLARPSHPEAPLAGPSP